MRFIAIISLVLLLTIGAWAEEIELTILATADVHGHIENPKASGDWLRLATLIRQQRAAAGEANTILLDSGDTLQGSFVGAVSQGEAVRLLMDHLRYDAWALGNHDLDFGTERLAAVIAASKTPVLSGNLTLGGKALPAYRIIERGGARVAVIGMNSWALDTFLWGDDVQDYTVTPAIQALEKVMPAVMAEEPDAIILALHGGEGTRDVNGDMEIYAIAKRFRQIDVVLGGHSHASVGGKILSGGWFIQAGSRGRNLGRVRLTIDTEKHRVIRKESVLIPVTPDIPADPEARAVVADWLARTEEIGDTVLTTPTVDVTPAGLPGEDCLLSEIICRAFAAAAPDCDAVLQGTHNRYYWSGGREVTMENVFNVIPYENRLAQIHVTPAELMAILNEQLTYRPKRKRLGIWGVEAVRGVGGTVIAIRDRRGQPWPDDKRISLVLNGFRLASAGGHFPHLAEVGDRPETAARDLQVGAREALVRYLAGEPDWSPPRIWYLPVPGKSAAPKTPEPVDESELDAEDSAMPD